jgi:hypothetical protein
MPRTPFYCIDLVCFSVLVLHLESNFQISSGCDKREVSRQYAVHQGAVCWAKTIAVLFILRYEEAQR